MARKRLIQIRRGTASEWGSANPVLAAGEPGLETDTRILKFGNGTDTWDDLWFVQLEEPATPPAPGTISYVGAHAAEATSVATTNIADDLLIVFAHRSGSSTAPTLATGFNEIGSDSTGGGGTNVASIVGWRKATGSNEGTGTWANATAVECIVLRGSTHLTPIGGFEVAPGAGGGTVSATTYIRYPAVNLQVTDGSSWLVAFGGKTTGAGVPHADIATPPSGMDNRTSVPATPYVSAHTATERSTNWGQSDVTSAGTSAKYQGWVIEIKA